MAVVNFVKRIQDVMRNNAGVNGDAQRIEQIVWTLFLKIYDAKEEEWELCSAEGHVSHIFADRMSSRPLGRSKTGADKMSRLQILNLIREVRRNKNWWYYRFYMNCCIIIV